MSWTELVGTYAVAALTLAWLSRKNFRNAYARLLRTVCFGTAILLLGDIVAEQRGLWLIPSPAGPLLLGAPLENISLSAGSILFSLALYLSLKDRLRARTSGRSK